MTPVVGIIMGSDSDWSTMEAAADALAEFAVPFEVGVVSAHRTVRKMVDYATSAADRGLRVVITGAGGAAHLPGMVAALTPLPVIGVPVPLRYLDGMDSLLSIVQMPAGVPVATVSIGGARNAGLLAVRILGASDPVLRTKMADFQAGLEQVVAQKDAALRAELTGRAPLGGTGPGSGTGPGGGTGTGGGTGLGSGTEPGGGPGGGTGLGGGTGPA